ncbi:hypothetical protein AVEN_116971-1 [Araneus ventricosus]|uniref:Uncharacterized protein n=1 Tax=Araneus ventricosus TaxID=182803 RepID=A0A4Y2U974_ARAVE|nr:hypothetical protein AVEN_90029-1 [Araneus ventricosus]GBO08198.1 hypothetical protein AVEN_116971-1 [Araneus ventricosus]
MEWPDMDPGPWRPFWQLGGKFGDLADKSMIPENATLFSISLLGKKDAWMYEKTPCDFSACRVEYIRSALESVCVCVDPLERL